MKYVTARDIIIPAGTEIASPPIKSTRWGKDYEAIVALGPDHCGYFAVDIGEGLDSGHIVASAEA